MKHPTRFLTTEDPSRTPDGMRLALRAFLGPLTLLLACTHAHGRGPGPLPSHASMQDPLLAAMKRELDRNIGQHATPGLRLAGYEPPYSVSFTVKDSRRAALTARSGSLAADESEHTRKAAADVRVGSYAFDNSNDPDFDWVEEGVYQPSNTLPLDDAPEALAHALWLLADFRYKQALASYLKLKGEGVYRLDDPDAGPSFSPTPPVEHLAPSLPFTHDRERWLRRVRALAARLAVAPHLFDTEVSFEATAETRWLVTSEGTRLRTSQRIYHLHATGWTQADDGMLLDHSYHAYAPAESALPDDRTLDQAIDQLIATLSALREAPVLEPFTGPAILDPTATGVLFHEILGHRLEGHRHAEDDGQTFARYLGQPILPPFLSLADDPTLASFGATPLNGHYTHDDEGVVAERVLLVDRGVLRSFLDARRPGPGSTRSNGHGRAEGTRRPVARQANLIVLAHETVSPAELRARLLAEVRRQKKPFGLILRDLSGGQTNTSSFGYQAFKGEARTVYKVDAESGQETLVRGVDLVGTPLATIGKILAASSEQGVFNGFCGAESGMVPVSATAPATLFSEVELQRSNRPRARPPVLPNPTHPGRSTPPPSPRGRP